MAIQFQGKKYDAVGQDKMTPGEIDAVERVTGLTFQKIRFMGETCVCEHGVKDHSHQDAEGNQTEDTSCVKCSCTSHTGDVPTRVSTAFAWVSVKRGNPQVSFSQFSDQPLMEMYVDDEEADASDPTEEPQLEASPT